jgi:hypothetical protein
MKRIGELLAVVLCTAALMLSLGSVAQKPVAAANPGPVIVTNTPLPTTAAQSGTWNVGVTGTPSVTVGNSINSPVKVVDVSIPAREPFQTTLCSIDQDEDCPTFNNSATYAVPVNKRLTIEYVSGSCFSKPNTSQVFEFALQTGGLINHYFVPQLVGTNAVARFQSVAQETRLNADPGTIIQVFPSNSGGTKILCVASLAGYLQPAP